MMHFSSIFVAAALAFSVSSLAAETNIGTAAAPGVYLQIFANQTGCIEGPGYQTFKLVNTVTEAMQACDAMQGCVFINTYHDNNSEGKNHSSLLTAALFNQTHTVRDATNTGQVQHDGTRNNITESAGYNKVIAV